MDELLLEVAASSISLCGFSLNRKPVLFWHYNFTSCWPLLLTDGSLGNPLHHVVAQTHSRNQYKLGWLRCAGRHWEFAQRILWWNKNWRSDWPARSFLHIQEKDSSLSQKFIDLSSMLIWSNDGYYCIFEHDRSAQTRIALLFWHSIFVTSCWSWGNFWSLRVRCFCSINPASFNHCNNEFWIQIRRKIRRWDWESQDIKRF